MSHFILGAIGVHLRAGPDFTLHRPRGSGDYVFLMFHVPVAIKFEYAQEFHFAGAGACVFYTPGHLHYFYGVNAQRRPAILDNSFVHFDGRRARTLAKLYDVPRNSLFYPARPHELLRCLQRLRQETLERGRFWQTRASLTLEDLFLLAGRHRIAEQTSRRERRRAEIQDAFRALRAEVHGNLTRHWTIDAMAKFAHLSPSRFAALYTENFGVAPIDDLIDARLAQARELLTNTTLPVKTVAAMSGFYNIYYFSRMFRKRVGVAPRDYYVHAVPS
jgi:AraC-like DNA-binding protein